MIRVENLTKIYKNRSNQVYAINDMNFEMVNPGLYTFIGPSGSGKSTLLNLIAMLETPSNGKLFIDNEFIDFNNKKQCDEFRLNKIGIVFQQYNLISTFSVIDNIRIIGIDSSEEIQKFLKIVRLDHKINTKVNYLSEGEKQRLAIARALAKNSKILLLDEPTGSLDMENAEQIFSILRNVSKDKIVILMTHNLEFAYKFSDFIFEIKLGQLFKTYDLTEKKSNFLIKENVFESYMEIENYVKKYFRQENDELKIHYFNGTTLSINMSSASLLENVKEIVDGHIGEEIQVEFIGKPKSQLKMRFIDKPSNSIKNNLFLKYSYSLFASQKKRTILSLFLLFFSLVLIFIYFNLTCYNKDLAAAEAINKNNYEYLNIESQLYNVSTDNNKVYTYGNYLFDRYKHFDNYIYYDIMFQPKYQFTSADNCLKTRIFIIDEEDYAVKITDFAYFYLFSKNYESNQEITFINSNISFDNLSFKITECVSTNFSLDMLNEFLLDQEFYLKYVDDLENIYNVIYISKAAYLQALQNAHINLTASNFMLSDTLSSIYALKSNSLVYTPYLQENLFIGKAPKKKDEICVSLDFYHNFMSEFSLEGVIGKEFSYKDIYSGINANLYQDKMNFYEILSKVTISGICLENDADVYCSEEFFQEIILSSYKYSGEGMGVKINQNSNELVTFIHQNNDVISLKVIQPIYLFEHIIYNFAGNILLAFGIFFIFLSGFVAILLSIGKVNSKLKDIAILHSLGKRKISISKIFYFYNIIFSFMAIVMSYIFGIISIHFINLILSGEKFFSINYDILTMTPWAFLAVLFLALGLSILTTFFSLKYSYKDDINLTIKNN